MVFNNLILSIFKYILSDIFMATGELETFSITLNGFTYTIWQFVGFYQYPYKGSLMMVVRATESCR
jgi:hypothetical protein